MTVAGPGDIALAAAAHRRSGAPNFQHAGLIRLQRHAQIARVVQARRRIAEAEHGQHLRVGQQHAGVGLVNIVDLQAGMAHGVRGLGLGSGH